MRFIKAGSIVLLLSILLSGYSWSADYTFDITIAGSGVGTVTSSPSGISCGADCSGSYLGNTTVTLTTSSANGYAFNGWDGACIGVSSTCSVTMDEAKSVTANFGALYTRRYEKVAAYFVATLGRPATAQELEEWSQVLDAYNGNVWRAGLVAYLNDNGTPNDLASLTSGMSHTQIVQTLYGNMVGETPHADVLNFYVNHLDAGTIKVRGLANAIMNDMGLMPRIDGVYTRPSTWTTDLSMYLNESHRDTMKHRVEVARYFTDEVAISQPQTTHTTGANLVSDVTADFNNVLAVKSMIYVISIGGNPNDSDDDGDFYTDNQGDCNDAVAGINPDATDICDDGVDQNCDGVDAVYGVDATCLFHPDDVDNDCDGFTENQGDCKKIIDSEGDVLEVTDQGSPLYGTTLDIPPGALSEPRTITVTALDTLPENLTGIALAGQAIALGPHGLTFNQPVTLTLNFSDTNNDGIIDGTIIDEEYVKFGYYNESSQEWEPLEIIAKDFQKNTVSVRTNHFSVYFPFVNDDSGIPANTQFPPIGGIAIDGQNKVIDELTNEKEWDDLNPMQKDADPDGDSFCGVGTDIKHVYTALDDNFAYLMVETHHSISPNMTIEVGVDFKDGHDLWNDPYGDFAINFHGSDLLHLPNGTSLWNQSGSINFGFDPNHSSSEMVVKRNNVLEAKIPLSVIDPDNPISRFNIIYIKTIDYSQDIECDFDGLFPRINWFRFHKRTYGNNIYPTFFNFGYFTREGKFINDIKTIKQIEITDPNEAVIISYNQSKVASEVYSSTSLWSYGSYDSNGDIQFSPFGSESYFVKRDFHGQILIPGTYKIAVTYKSPDSKSLDIFENDFTVNRVVDIPMVDDSSVDCLINSSGDLSCAWDYPVFRDFGFDQTEFYSHAWFTARKGGIGGTPEKILIVGMHKNDETLRNNVTIPSYKLNELVEGVDTLTFRVRLRLKPDDVRTFSIQTPIDISTIQ